MTSKYYVAHVVGGGVPAFVHQLRLHCRSANEGRGPSFLYGTDIFTPGPVLAKRVACSETISPCAEARGDGRVWREPLPDGVNPFPVLPSFVPDSWGEISHRCEVCGGPMFLFGAVAACQDCGDTIEALDTERRAVRERSWCRDREWRIWLARLVVEDAQATGWWEYLEHAQRLLNEAEAVPAEPLQ